MARVRALRGFTAGELASELAALDGLERSFDEAAPAREPGWHVERSEAVIAEEPAGAPRSDGAFARARDGVARFLFSDPRIVTGYFDERAPLLGRRMLLEIRVLGLRFLNGVVVARVADEQDDRESAFGFRYDTLEGHIERGWEWFLLTKDHASGEVRFCIESRWRRGELPAWWERAGFALLAGPYREAWLRRAHRRLAALAAEPAPRHGARHIGAPV